MSDYVRCKVCKEWGFADRHQCPPTWEARIHDTKWEEDWTVVHAHDAESAAEKFAEEYDCDGGEYVIIQNGSAQVEVRKRGEETVHLFEISAESVPQYSAYPA